MTRQERTARTSGTQGRDETHTSTRHDMTARRTRRKDEKKSTANDFVLLMCSHLMRVLFAACPWYLMNSKTRTKRKKPVMFHIISDNTTAHRSYETDYVATWASDKKITDNEAAAFVSQKYGHYPVVRYSYKINNNRLDVAYTMDNAD